jgi:hypothetical protein
MIFLGLAACQLTPEPIVNSTPKPFQTSNGFIAISGKVEGWNRGVQKIAIQFIHDPSNKTLIQSTIDAMGQFQLDLSSVADETTLSEFSGCAGMTIAPGFKNGLIPAITVLSSTGSLLGTITHSNADIDFVGSIAPASGTTLVNWIYANKTSEVRGTCPPLTYDADLKQGWNTVIVEYPTPTTYTSRSGQTSSHLIWRFLAR